MLCTTHFHAMGNNHVRIQRGDRLSGAPLKNHSYIGFFSNFGPDPVINHKLPNQHSMLGPS